VIAGFAVIAGSLTGVPVLVDAGAVLLVTGLVIALAHAVRRAPPVPRLVGWPYRCLLAFLMISAPVGAVLAHLRSSR